VVALPLVGLLLAIWACGFSIGPHVGARPLPTTQRPDVNLRLAIQITGQYSGAANVGVMMRVFEGANTSEVALPNNVRVTCDGKAAGHNPFGSLYLQCPRQPPGGAYLVGFTDSHGASTTLIIPVPLGTFAIVSPRDGAVVPIPTDGALVVRYTEPSPPANGKVAVDNLTASCNLTETTPCGAVYANLQPQPTPTPDPRQPTATPYAIHVAPTPTPGPNGSGTPVPVYTPVPTIGPPTPTVAVTRNGQEGVVYLTGDYITFVPAPGTLTMSVEVNETPAPAGFEAVSVTYSDNSQSHITWTR
jgi:hypothetical protein